MTKEEILASYLNESPYGGTIYGIEEAQSFFNKSASEITLRKTTAALPSNHLSPYGNNFNLLENGLDLYSNNADQRLYHEEYNEALEQEVEFQPQVISGIRAPHFVMYIREQLVEMYGEQALTDRGYQLLLP